MTRFKKIFIFIDSEDDDNPIDFFMIKKALRIARLSQARITILSVIKEFIKPIDLSMATSLKTDIQNLEIENKKNFSIN